MRQTSVASTSSKPPSTSRTTKPPPSSQTGGVKRQRVDASDDERPRRPAVGKGKAKEDPIDLGDEDTEMESNIRAHATGGRGRPATNGRDADTGGESVGSLKRQLEKMREQLDEAIAARDKYHDQLQELHARRMTVPEEAGQKITEVWEKRNKVQEEIISELRLLAGDEEPVNERGSQKQTIEGFKAENTRLSVELARARKAVEDNDQNRATIRSLENDVRKLQHELQVERTYPRNNNRPPGSASKASSASGSKEAEYPGFSQVIQLYEDMTCVSVLNHQVEESAFPGKEDNIYMCYVSAEERSVAFTLKFFWAGPEDPEVTSSIERLVLYSPTSLQNETDIELVQSLDFLAESFQFAPWQLHTFLKSLVERVRGGDSNN